MLERCLSLIVSNPDLHARWLNTFSFLEYIGFRKIVKSQNASSMSLETLSHAVEEGRHALKLKHLAMKVGGARFDRYEPETLLCEEEAEAYFQRLDHHCESSFADVDNDMKTRLTYLYVTWLVEVRALEVYGCYHSALQTHGLPATLQGLLKEEEGHLHAVESELRQLDPQFSDRVKELQKVEEQLYRSFFQALTNRLFSVSADYHAECT
jgi:hypothetical protein